MLHSVCYTFLLFVHCSVSACGAGSCQVVGSQIIYLVKCMNKKTYTYVATEGEATTKQNECFFWPAVVWGGASIKQLMHDTTKSKLFA